MWNRSWEEIGNDGILLQSKKTLGGMACLQAMFVP